jgi:hypothetical protein
MTRQTITLYNAQQGHKELMRLWVWCKAMLMAEHRLTVEARPEKRSDAQNRLMWSALGDCARQIEWHGQKLDAESWKDMATAALKRQRVVPGIDGGFVVLGQRTSRMTKAEMTELIEFVHCFGSQQGVQWSPASIAQDLNAMDQA